MSNSFENHAKVLVFQSFKGGTGKTIFSINLAEILVRDYNKRVLLIESDFSMPALQNILPEYNPDIFFNDFLNSNDVNLEKYIYPNIQSNLGIIFCNIKAKFGDKINSTDHEWFLRKKKQLELAISNINYDYVIFDAIPGLHLFVINLIAMTDVGYLLMRPDAQSIKGTEYLLEKIYTRSLRLKGQNSFKLNLIMNQVPYIDEIQPLLVDWEKHFTTKYDYVNKLLNFYYHPTTSYNTAIQRFVLPDDDPSLTEIKKKIVSDLLEI
ncbi:MAG: AAA family ATPase [Candidatus Heimdallarchaeota archaeon]|nr:AAA family ATPase [Candidatus Heimdallarchaeota archaeon]